MGIQFCFPSIRAGLELSSHPSTEYSKEDVKFLYHFGMDNRSLDAALGPHGAPQPPCHKWTGGDLALHMRPGEMQGLGRQRGRDLARQPTACPALQLEPPAVRER